MAGVEADGGDGAVAVEVDVVGEERGEARVGLDAEEGAGEGGGEGAGDFEVEEGGFEAGGGVHGGEDGGGGEFGGVVREEVPGGGVVGFWGGGERGGEGVEVSHCSGEFVVVLDGLVDVTAGSCCGLNVLMPRWSVLVVIPRVKYQGCPLPPPPQSSFDAPG